MQRITKEVLRARVEYLNYLTQADYSLSCAYGGFNLVSRGGGYDVLSHGHIPARELLYEIDAFIKGYQSAIDAIQKKAA